MHGTQKLMYERVKMFVANGAQPHNLNSFVPPVFWGEIASPISRDFVAHLDQALARFFVIRLDTAVLPDHAAASDIGNPQLAYFRFETGNGDRLGSFCQ